MSVEYRLVRSRRRTLALHIMPDAALEVRAPLRLPQSRIDQFLREKEAWLAQHLAAVNEQLAHRQSFAPERLLLLGRDYAIRALPEQSRPAFDGACFLLPQGGWDEVCGGVITLYRTLAREALAPRLQHWSAAMGIVPAGWSISGAAKRWGSCSGKNRLCFAWRLVMAHPDAVDYVVVHELAHIRFHDHSPAFWAEVALYLPDYKRRQLLLRKLQERLSGENWGGQRPPESRG